LSRHMGNSISESKIARKGLFNKPVKVVVAGVGGSGKTQLVYRLKLGNVGDLKLPSDLQLPGENAGEELEETSDLAAPHFMSYPSLTKYQSMTLVDTSGLDFAYGGRGGMRYNKRSYFRGANGIVFTLDSADLQVEEAQGELGALLSDSNLAGLPLLVLANKNDLPAALTTTEISAKLGLEDLSATRKWRIESTSVKTGDGIAAGLDWLEATMCGQLIKGTEPPTAETAKTASDEALVETPIKPQTSRWQQYWSRLRLSTAA